MSKFPYLEHYPHVFAPLKTKHLTLKNRIQFPPTVSCLSTGIGEATPEYIEFVAMQAKTGVGLITIGATSVDEDFGTDFQGELNITRDEMIGGLARIAEAAHLYGAKISVEMCHAGRGADPTLLGQPYAIGPSSIPLPNRCRYVKEMDQHDIDHVIEQYASCAERLMRAGFDMCMVHGAHGNLVGSFLSPKTNLRNDCYGGSLENRMRFPLEILKAMRERVGDNMAIEMRISGDEMIEGGMRIQEVIEFLKQAQQYIDLVNVSRGLIVDRNFCYYPQPPYYHPYCHNVYLAEQVKACKEITIPVATVGSIKTLDMAEEILAAGRADVVAMARALFADPELIHNACRGRKEETRPCLRCLQVCNNNCDKGIAIRCAVNPTLGRETKYGEIRPAPVSKKVVVVGGGVAGMMAAQTLVKRGHRVVLFEKGPELGGHLNNINKLPFKQDLREYTEWDIRTTMTCGADIRLNTAATRELIEAEDPDAIFIATGSKLAVPPIPGIDGTNVASVTDVDCGRVATGQKVVVCGGGMSGLECALGLAMDGKEVTVVDMIPVEDFAKEIVHYTRDMLLKLLREFDVKLLGGQKVTSIDAQGVHTMDHNWKTYTYDCDTVVSAFGLVPNLDGVDEYRGLMYDTYVIGDCGEGAKSIGNANWTAFNYAMLV